jgi:hypothetical protein
MEEHIYPNEGSISKQVDEGIGGIPFPFWKNPKRKPVREGL